MAFHNGNGVIIVPRRIRLLLRMRAEALVVMCNGTTIIPIHVCPNDPYPPPLSIKLCWAIVYQGVCVPYNNCFVINIAFYLFLCR